MKTNINMLCRYIFKRIVIGYIYIYVYLNVRYLNLIWYCQYPTNSKVV